MSGNTYGKLFTVTTAGESHGPALVAIVDGCPPGLELSLEDLQRDLDRRKPGTSRHTTQRQEPDEVEILSGVFEGRTTGCAIGLLIRNTDQKSKDYSAIKDLFRPAHADYTYHHKYGERDYRGGGRSSARETAMRVAAGAIAKKYLATQGIVIRGYMSQLGPIEIPFKTWDSVEHNAFFSPDPDKVPELEAYMDQLRRDQDSVGAKITVVAEGVIPGLGALLAFGLGLLLLRRGLTPLRELTHAMAGIDPRSLINAWPLTTYLPNSKSRCWPSTPCSRGWKTALPGCRSFPPTWPMKSARRCTTCWAATAWP